MNKDQYDKIKGLGGTDKELELKLNNLQVRLDALGAPKVEVQPSEIVINSSGVSDDLLKEL